MHHYLDVSVKESSVCIELCHGRQGTAKRSLRNAQRVIKRAGWRKWLKWAKQGKQGPGAALATPPTSARIALCHSPL